jgi:hypothetical protein
MVQEQLALHELIAGVRDQSFAAGSVISYARTCVKSAWHGDLRGLDDVPG